MLNVNFTAYIIIINYYYAADSISITFYINICARARAGVYVCNWIIGYRKIVYDPIDFQSFSS